MRSLALLLAAAGAAGAANELPGGRAWMSQRALTFVQTQIIPMLVSEIEHHTIPDISGEKDSIKYSFSNFRMGGVNLSPKLALVPGTGLSLTLNSITAALYCDWEYKEKHWPHLPNGRGTAKIDIDPVTMVGMTLEPGVSATTPTHPTLGLSGLHVALKLGHITIHGSMLSWLYDVLIDLVKHSIDKAVSSALNAAVTSFIDVDVAHFLSQLNLVVPLKLDPPFDVASIDFSLLSVNTSSSHLAINNKGEFVSRDPNDPPFPDTPPVLPDVPPSLFTKYMLSVSIKDWCAPQPHSRPRASPPRPLARSASCRSKNDQGLAGLRCSR